MTKFYDDYNIIIHVLCVKSMQFPFITVTNNICTKCNRDSHTPKLYSAANNMDPGTLPTELMVCLYNIHMYLHACLFSQYSNTDSDTNSDTDFHIRNEHFTMTDDQHDNATSLISTHQQLYAAILIPTTINTFHIFLAVVILT